VVEAADAVPDTVFFTTGTDCVTPLVALDVVEETPEPATCFPVEVAADCTVFVVDDVAWPTCFVTPPVPRASAEMGVARPNPAIATSATPQARNGPAPPRHRRSFSSTPHPPLR
jgi:hypothetical protein